MTAPAKRELVRWMVTQGLSERRCLGVVGMSASALRHEPRLDRNVALRAQIERWRSAIDGTGWG